jgi:hypothetical protein
MSRHGRAGFRGAGRVLAGMRLPQRSGEATAERVVQAGRMRGPTVWQSGYPISCLTTGSSLMIR